MTDEKWRLALRALSHGPKHRVFNSCGNIFKLEDYGVKLFSGLSWIDADSLPDPIPVSGAYL